VRIVLDTDVVVSALIWGSTLYKLLQATTAGAIDLYTSTALLIASAMLSGGQLCICAK